MKKQLILASMFCAAACFAQNADTKAPAAAEPAGALLKSISFDTAAGFQQWPDDSQIELDDETFKEGKASIVFTPDNNFVAYFYQKLIPGHEYTITCWVKMESDLIKRCGISVSFAKQGGGNSSAGRVHFPFTDLAPADNEWHQCKVTFKAPEEAVRGQVMLAMHRANTTVFIDDFKMYDMSAKSVAANTTVTQGKVLKSMKFTNTVGLMSDPKGKIVLGKAEENDGRACLVFTPNNDKDCLAYTVYYYQKITPGKYAFEFDYLAPSDPIARACLLAQFGGPGKKLGQLGTFTCKASDFGACDGSWQHAVIPVTVPEGTANARIMFAFFRTNVQIKIADFKIIQVEK